jgi:hypothetical protein
VDTGWKRRASLARRLQRAGLAVVLAGVGLIVQHAVHPLAGRRPHAGQGYQIDLGGGEPRLTQQSIHGLAGVAGVVP